MPEPAAPQTQTNQTPLNSNIVSNGSTTGTQEEINKLLAAVEKFRKTGLVEDSEVTFAKEKVLPKLGLSSEQINELGPVGIMVKLQEEADKKRLSVSGINSNLEPAIPKVVETSIPNLAKPPSSVPSPKIKTELETNIDENSFKELTKQVSKMTDNLSVDIDKEIKRQLEEKKALEQAQERVDTVLKEHEELSLPQINKGLETPKPTIGLFHTKTVDNTENKPPIIHDLTYPIHQPEPTQPENISTDPLEASIENAMNSLKEGDSIGSEWVLKKILTTSFGNKKSPFYELLNKSGAAWTLSPEEMRDALRSNILSKNTTPVKEINSEKVQPLHDLNKPDDKIEAKPSTQITEREVERIKEQLSEERKVNQPSARPKEPHEERHFETKEQTKPPEHHETTRTKPEVEKDEQKFEKEQVDSKEQGQAKFNQKQIDFLNKIHADQSLWNSFTSFNPELWQNFHDLYEEGKLISIGIDAHPLFDKLASNDFGSLIDIQKGDSASKILSEAGYNLSWTPEDAEIFAVHLIANHKILSDSAKKLEISGLTAPSLPSLKDVIDLTIGAKNGNHESLHKLEEALNFLPVGSKFKLIKPPQLDLLRKYFKR